MPPEGSSLGTTKLIPDVTDKQKENWAGNKLQAEKMNDPSSSSMERPPWWKIWAVASRPHTLTASISPVFVGHALALSLLGQGADDDVNSMKKGDVLSVSLPWAIFACLIQLGTNLHNDYADFVKGADDHRRVGHARATQRGWLTPSQTAGASTACLVVALAIGLDLARMPSTSSGMEELDPLMLFVLASSAFNAVAYTGGPYPLGYIGLGHISIGYTGLGDLFVLLYFGFVATVTVPYIILRRILALSELTAQQESPSPGDCLQTILLGPEMKSAFLAALPVGFLATAIIVVNNLRDRNTDISAGKHTTAVRFGETFARCEYAFLVLGSYACNIWFCLQPSQTLRMEPSYWMLLPLITVPLAIPQLQAVALGKKDGAALNSHVGGTARLQFVYCLLFTLGVRLCALTPVEDLQLQ